MSHSPTQSHKTTVEQFAEAINSADVSKLDSFLENDVQKTLDSKVVFKNLQEARDYYTKEHDANPSAQWKIVESHEDHPKGNTLRARVSHGDKTYNTAYTFGSSGKIHRISAVHHIEHGSSSGHANK